MLKEVRGYYIPSGFSIYLNADSTQGLDTTNSTFVHEYIHFLQDIILPYCIRDNLKFIKDFAWVSKVADESGQLRLSFRDWADDNMLTTKQKRYTWGKRATRSTVGEIKKIQSDFFTSSHNHDIYRHIVDWQHFPGQFFKGVLA